MADLGEMKIKIGADISGLANEIEVAKYKINALKTANVQLAEETKSLSSEYNKNAKELRELTDLQSKSTFNLDKYAGRVGFLKEQQQQLTHAIVDGKGVLKQSTSAIADLEKNLLKAENATGGFGKGIGTIYSGLKTIANILPGLGISTLIGLIAGPVIDAFSEWYNSINEVAEATKTLKANQSNLNEVLAEANKDAGKQTADLKVLYDTATNVNVSYKDRLLAVKELQKEFPSYFGNIKTETILNGGAKAQYDLLTISIIKNAQAKAVLNKIEGLAGQLLDNDIQKQKILNATANETNAILNKKVTNNQGGIGQNISKNALVAQVEARKKAALDINAANDKSLNDQIAFLTKFASLPSLATIIENQNKDKKTKEKTTNQFEIDLQALQRNYEEVQKLREQTLGANLTDATKNGIVVNDILLQDEIDFLNKKEALLKKYNKSDFENFKATESAKQKLKDANLRFIAEQSIQNLPLNIPDISKELKEKLSPKIDINLSAEALAAYTKISDINLNIIETTKNVNTLLAPAFDALFTGIIEGSNGAFKSFGEALNETLKKLAVAILKAAALAAIIKLLNPGAGAKSFGDIFKGLLGFAEGGHIKGPGSRTSDSILARLSAGEYVIKADTVAKFGVGFFDKINSGIRPSNYEQFMQGKGLPRFAVGGFVSPTLTSLQGALGSINASGQRVEIFGKFELRNDKLVAAVKQGTSQLNRST